MTASRHRRLARTGGHPPRRAPVSKCAPCYTNSQIASFSIGARAQLKPAGHPQLLPAGSAGIAAS